MDQVITFDRSLQERLNDYMDVLGMNTIRDIKKEWIFYLEFSLDPSGWQAIWKIPRPTCESLQIPYPTIVLIYVENVHFAKLAAVVKIIAVQDEISLPAEHVVPLLQLWPTKEQDKSIALNIENTAKSLELYRFFYTNILFPWDCDENDNSTDWFGRHMHTRLRLYYDIKNGVIPHATAEHIKSLITEAKRLQTKREQLESELSGNFEIEIEKSSDPKVHSLLDLNVKMVEIRNEVELLENPLTRAVIMKRQKAPAIESDTKESYWLVHDEGTITDYYNFLTQVKSHYPEETFKFTSLAVLVDILRPRDVVVLNKNVYSTSLPSGFEKGGHLMGIYDREDTTLMSENNDITLDFSGATTIENLTINAVNSKCAIVVRAGVTVLNNCKLIGCDKLSTHQGIIVLSGAELNLINCEISGFFMAIVGNSNAKINIENTEIYNVNFAVKIYDFCKFQAINCTLHDCKEYALCLETDKTIDLQEKSGNFEVLQIVPDISLRDMNGKNNVKGDVLINQKSKITPLQDLFSDPNFEPTEKRKDSDSSDGEEEMELGDANTTVIERSNASP